MQSSSIMRRVLSSALKPLISNSRPASQKLTPIGLMSLQNDGIAYNNYSSRRSLFDYDLFNGFFDANQYQPQLALENVLSDYDVNDIDKVNDDIDSDNNDATPSIWDSIVLMAVPKSRKSKGKKRMKHKQHMPDRINWATCPKCNEPRRPHRICKKNLDVCGMRLDEWEAFKEEPKNSERVSEIVKKYTFGTWKSK